MPAVLVLSRAYENTKLLIDVHYVLYMSYVLKVVPFMIGYIQLS